MKPEESKTTEAQRNLHRFAVAWAAFSLLLVAVTWQLWFPSLARIEYPEIPLFGVRSAHLSVLSSVISGIIVTGLIGALTLSRSWCWGLVSGGLAAAFLIDQHHMQPWAYLLAIDALMLATLDPKQVRRWIIPLSASIYIYSAIGKLDYQFTHTVGQDFLQAATSPLHDFYNSLGESSRVRMALAFPTIELIAGVGLLFRPTRQVAGLLVMVMHATLIALLGPWALQQSAGVLCWNAALLFRVYWWMVKADFHPDQVSQTEPPRWAKLTKTVVLIALLAPIGERWGWWDHWLSWSLYSPHTSRVDVQVHQTAISKLDRDLQVFVLPDDDGDGWQTFSLTAWSLEARGVPVYPQSRYQLALAVEFATANQLDRDIRARLRSMSDRWTGRREETLLFGRDELRRKGTGHLLSP